MKGTRPLSNEEIIKVRDTFTGLYAVRNRSLFMLGVSIGGRISELLGLKIGDVWQNEFPVTDVVFDKSIVKGGEVSRAVPVNSDGTQAIDALIAWHVEQFGDLVADAPLFPSRKGGTALTRKAADDALKTAFELAGLNGKLGTHSLRKSFAQRLYDELGDIFAVGQMLGHKHTDTTQKYLGVNYRSVREGIEAMAVSVDQDRNTTPVYKAKDMELIHELTERGYAGKKDGKRFEWLSQDK